MKFLILLCIVCVAYATQVINLPNKGYSFVNTEGNFLEQLSPKGADIQAGLGGSITYSRYVNGEARLGYCSGLVEAVVLTRFGEGSSVANFENVYTSRIVEYSSSKRAYIEIVPDSESPIPPPRSHGCGSFDKRTGILYIFGGTNAPANFTNLGPENLFSDTWSFNFNTLFWTEESPTGTSPDDRASMACANNGTHLFIYSGASITAAYTIGDFNPNDLYSLGYPATAGGTLTWTQLKAPFNTDFPEGRTQCVADRLPGTSKIIFRGGDRFSLPDFTRTSENDIFIYNFDTDIVTILNNATNPLPSVTQEAHIAISPNIFFIQNGDQQGNLTLEQTCTNPNFVCGLPNTPTNRTYIYVVHLQKYYEIRFGREIPSTRRSNLNAYITLNNGTTIPITDYDFASSYGDSIHIIFNGGYGWNGRTDGFGEVRNPYTFELKLTLIDLWD